MEKAPITFEYDGLTFRGVLSPVYGAHANCWHLMIDNFYFGCLVLKSNNEWDFQSPKDFFPGMADHFGAYLIAWYQ